MRKMLIGAAAGVLLAGGLMAQPAQAKEKAKAAAPTCPACKMTLSTKKTKDNPQAVKINGKTYYCCAKCDMNKKK
jgi:hypothetical protein